MDIISFAGGPGAVNTYIIYGGDLSAVIIDPSDNDKICDLVSFNNLKPCAILLTHGHFDHVWAMKEIIGKYNIPYYIHKDDVKIVSSSVYNFSEVFGYTDKSRYVFPDPVLINDCDVLSFSDMTFKVLHTPGHTPGGVCYQIENMLFTGDTLFRGTVGRTDCYFADQDALFESLKKFSRFNDNTIVYPGHGRSSTIGFELANNPFLINKSL